MSEIEHFLNSGEKVLWEKKWTTNLYKEVSPYYFGGYLSVFLFIPLSLFFLFSPSLYPSIRIYAFMVSLIIGVSLVLLFLWLGKKMYKKLKTRTNMGKNELKNYSEFNVITNYRYIQRDYSINFDSNNRFNTYSYDCFELKNDIAYAKLDCMNVVFLENLHEQAAICFYFDYNKEKIEYSDLFIDIEWDKVTEVMKILKEIMKFKRSELTKFGNKIYYRK